MKKLILFIVLLMSMQAMSGNKESEMIGYVVWKSGVITAIPKQYTNIEVVQRVYDYYFPNIKMDVEETLKYSPFVQITTQDKAIYIEKKIFLKKRNNGTWKTKKIKK